MADGGASAKQLHLCLDARVWCETEVFMATAQDRGIAREFALKGRDLEPAVLTPLQAHLGLQETFTVSALVAFDYLHWLVDASGGLITLALEPDDIRRAKERNGIALCSAPRAPACSASASRSFACSTASASGTFSSAGHSKTRSGRLRRTPRAKA